MFVSYLIKISVNAKPKSSQRCKHTQCFFMLMNIDNLRITAGPKVALAKDFCHMLFY